MRARIPGRTIILPNGILKRQWEAATRSGNRDGKIKARKKIGRFDRFRRDSKLSSIPFHLLLVVHRSFSVAFGDPLQRYHGGSHSTGELGLFGNAERPPQLFFQPSHNADILGDTSSKADFAVHLP